MNPEKLVHILGLSTREQYQLRLLMSNLMAGYIDKSICEAPWANADSVATKADNTIKFFQRYVEFCDMLCPESMMGRGKPKVMMIGATIMKYLVLAVNGYDSKENYLNAEQRTALDPFFIALKKKVEESSQYKYNSWEIEKAKHAK